MTGNKIGLLDSNVIIDASKGIISIEQIVNRYDLLYTSIINYVEVLGYNFDNEQEREIIVEILDTIPCIALSKEIADIAIEIRKRRKIN